MQKNQSPPLNQILLSQTDSQQDYYLYLSLNKRRADKKMSLPNS